jgi:hypothetical protein
LGPLINQKQEKSLASLPQFLYLFLLWAIHLRIQQGLIYNNITRRDGGNYPQKRNSRICSAQIMCQAITTCLSWPDSSSQMMTIVRTSPEPFPNQVGDNSQHTCE